MTLPLSARLLPTALAFLCAMLVSCASGPTNSPGPERHGPVPDYAAIAAAYNPRVAMLDRLSASTGLVIEARGEDGKKVKEQVEGNLQIILPDRVALRVDKVGQTVFYLGSNPERYWWFDLAKEHTALVGRHDKASPQAVEAFGIPVHPLDLVELLGIRPLPATEPGAKVEWSTEGRLAVTLPGRWGQRRFILDPQTYRPAAIELLDGEGRAVVAAKLSRYTSVTVFGIPPAPQQLAERLDIVVPSLGAEVVLMVYQPENPGDRMRSRPFDLDALLSAYRIESVMDIDAPREAGR